MYVLLSADELRLWAKLGSFKIVETSNVVQQLSCQSNKICNSVNCKTLQMKKDTVTITFLPVTKKKFFFKNIYALRFLFFGSIKKNDF